MRYFCLFLNLLTLAAPGAAETGYDAWLRYASIDDAAARKRYATLPANAVALGDSVVIRTAQAELIRGVRGMLGRTLRAEGALPHESAIVLVTFAADGYLPAPKSIEVRPEAAGDYVFTFPTASAAMLTTSPPKTGAGGGKR